MEIVHEKVANEIALFRDKMEEHADRCKLGMAFDNMVNELGNILMRYNEVDPHTFITACNKEIT